MSSMVIPVFLYSLIMTGTPGPNNMMLTASGAQFGYRRTLPLLIGIVLGMLAMLVLSAVGLGAIFQRFPLVQQILKVVGSAYLLYLAFKVAFSDKMGDSGERRDQPLGMWHGVVFQFVNPKAYVIAITAMSVYPMPGDRFVPSAIIVLAVFALVAPVSSSLWAGFGTVLGRVLAVSRYRRAVNYALGALTAVSVVFIWI